MTKTHDLIREKVADGYDIIYIGRKGDPEPEGAMGVAPDHVFLVENLDDIEALSIDNDKIAVTNQTTMSQWDTAHLMNAVKEKYPQAEIYNEICMATQTRQQAVAEQAKGADLCIVVGDPRSNNSNRLAQVAEEIAAPRRTASPMLQRFNANGLRVSRRWPSLPVHRRQRPSPRRSLSTWSTRKMIRRRGNPCARSVRIGFCRQLGSRDLHTCATDAHDRFVHGR